MDRIDDKRVLISGVGMTAFEKPKTKKWNYYDFGREAGVYAKHRCFFLTRLNQTYISYLNCASI